MLEQYKIIRSLGKGGMGEVFLVHDTVCDREVALKKIRPDLIKHKVIRERFLREAKIAAQLTHPSIVPIYQIIQEKDALYYIMPYVEGETLKKILKTSKEEERQGEILHPIGGSIPALLRIFWSVCQAIHYAHNKKILHRDIKPDNIIVGKYGETMILDWGLADYLENPSIDPSIETQEEIDFTKPGKIVGTLAFMPPERVKGELASISTDIYALGAMLYQILTLRLPFQRKGIESFKREMRFERLVEPEEIAPYRDIPKHLADIAKKCLSPVKKERYSSVQALLGDLESYIEGRPEWVPVTTLSFSRKKDWAFSENVIIAKYMAITRGADVMEWVNLRISRLSFSQSSRLETEVILGKKSQGIGFLMGILESIPSAIEKGYLLWLSGDESQSSKLNLRGIEVMSFPGLFLTPGKKHQIRIEKTLQNFRFFLDGELKCNFLTHIPNTGAHIGLLLRDDALQLQDLSVAAGSLNAMVNCLAVPDAFAAHGDYSTALAEYRRTAEAFSGRTEGREAIFRAGVTLIEEARKENKKGSRQKYLTDALTEFNKLRGTPGEPLEYLGKSLVYKTSDNLQEESKCLELAVRKFRRHPLFSLLAEHIAFRLHESSAKNRTAAFTFALLAVRHLPDLFANPDHKNLLTNLTSHLEPIPFIEPTGTRQNLALILAFWLAKPLLIQEQLESGLLNQTEKENALYCLAELGVGRKKERSVWQIVQDHLDQNKPEKAFKLGSTPQRIWGELLQSNWGKAEELLNTTSSEERLTEISPLFFLYGCYLRATAGKGAALSHFRTMSEGLYPPSPALLGRYLLKKKSNWHDLFFWERKQLYREIVLFYHCAKDRQRAKLWAKKIQYAATSYSHSRHPLL